MKRFLILLVMVALLVPTVALASSTDFSSMSDEELQEMANAIASEQQNRAKSESGYILSGELGVYFVGLKDVVFSEGNKTVTLVMDFSHTDSKSRAFYMSIMPKIFQDGIECEQDYMSADKEGQKEIKDGVTIEVTKTFKLSSGSPIEIELDELISFDDIKLETTVPVE